MKRLFAMISAIVPLFVAAPLSAHHAADGIVSDEIYEMITLNLDAADSPHLDMDLSLIMDPSDDTVITGAVITVTVPTGQVTTVLEAISETLDALAGEGEEIRSSLDNPMSSLNIQIDDDTSGWVTITITETIGGGNVPQEAADPEPIA